MKTSLESLGRNLLLIAQWKNVQQSLSGEESAENDERSGRPKDACTDKNVKVVHTLAMCERRRNMQNIASEEGISFGTVYIINPITDSLGILKDLAVWMPRILTYDQKRTLLDIVSLQKWSWQFYPASCNQRWDMGSPLWHRVKNAEQTLEAPWLTPSQKFKRVHSAGGGGWWFRSFGIVKRWLWWLSWARSHDKRFILCRRIEAATPGNRQKEARETESRCSALAVQHRCLTSQVGMTAATECWFEILFSSPIFSWFGSFWLLSVPKTEIQASWFTVWKQWRRHRGSKKVLWGPGTDLLFLKG